MPLKSLLSKVSKIYTKKLDVDRVNPGSFVELKSTRDLNALREYVSNLEKGRDEQGENNYEYFDTRELKLRKSYGF